MNQANPRLTLGLFALLLAACGSTKVVDSWQSEQIAPATPDKVAVLVMWPEDGQRRIFERDIAEELRDAGINAVPSSAIPGMQGRLTRERIEVALRNANADGVIAVFVIGGGRDETLERRNYWLEHVGTGVGGWYRPYFYDVYTVREGSGWADGKSHLMLETVYADVRRIERVWSMVTASEDLEFQDLVARLAERIVEQMKRTGQI